MGTEISKTSLTFRLLNKQWLSLTRRAKKRN